MGEIGGGWSEEGSLPSGIVAGHAGMMKSGQSRSGRRRTVEGGRVRGSLVDPSISEADGDNHSGGPSVPGSRRSRGSEDATFARSRRTCLPRAFFWSSPSKLDFCNCSRSSPSSHSLVIDTTNIDKAPGCTSHTRLYQSTSSIGFKPPARFETFLQPPISLPSRTRRAGLHTTANFVFRLFRSLPSTPDDPLTPR